MIDWDRNSETLRLWDETYDILVVGSGFAGICAAIEARKAGRNVLILEKMPTAGGNSVIDSGELSAVGSSQQKRIRVHDSAALLADDILTNGEHMNDLRKVDYIASHAHEIYEWTKALGVRWTRGIAQAGGHSVARVIVTHTGSGREIYECLSSRYSELGGRIRLNSYVDRILRDPKTGRVAGLLVREGYRFPDPASGTAKRIRAKQAVILCHGGFSADASFVHQIAPEIPADVGTTNQPGATSELWREAQRIGCMLQQTGWVQCTPWNNPKEKGQGIGWIFSEYAAADFGLWVNSLGRRFVNETANRRVRSNAMFAQQRLGLRCFALADEKGTHEIEEMRKGYLEDVLAKGLVQRFSSLEDLARSFGIPEEDLENEIALFNEAIARRRDAAFGRNLRQARPLTGGLWYAAEMTPRIHHSLGGIATDPEGRALDRDTQAPIPGLYAAGEAAGGVHGACRLGACAILDCLAMGRLAGRTASSES